MATSETSETSGGPPPSGTFRAICFTEFGDPPDWDVVQHKLRFMAYGLETCPTTQREHYQGFAYAHKPMRWKAWKKLFPRAHFEKMAGSFQDNVVYCSKQSSLIKFGEEPKQGERKDLIDLKRKLEEYAPRRGTTTYDVAEDEAYFGVVARHNTFASGYLRHKRAKILNGDRTMPKVYVRIGPPGTGKTRWLDRKFGVGGYVIAPDNTGKWFDGCDHDVILFDDVEIDQVPPLSLWKRLCDRYPFEVPVKGGFITWKPRVIVFTSNHAVHEWWKDITPDNQQAIARRIYKTVYVDGTDGDETQEEFQSDEDSEGAEEGRA
ncbi:replication-associated protein [Ctenophore-associated circular virus 1]|uniref:replication-associated protein n=1 Tax=Ctenophore-associated circular virus 1 TaxID=1778558 RepID=UPI000764CEDD|nr:replication-associated protein [Ctenophore-associated circular virus 1]ALY05856.1 replication-associated protein [Ctenophore-associated circular virus 1]